jgi:hypothetical protein
MPTHSAARHVRISRLSVVAAIALSFISIDCLRAESIFSIGAKETVYSSSQRKKKGKAWPDGNFGVLSNGDGTYDFYAANSSKIKITSGTLTDPAAKKIGTGKIYNLPKKTYKYVAGGPIYEDPSSGARLMVYHAEIHKKGKYSSLLGLAASVDPSGKAFYDLGPIVTPNMPHLQASFSVDVGGGSFAVKDGYFNVYYRDYLANGASSQLAVARAPLDELLSDALAGRHTGFTKYYDGSWSQPGIGGMSSALESPNKANWWSSASYNEYLDQMVLVTSEWKAGGTGPDLYMITSDDGVNWSSRQPLVLDAGEQMYPTIVGTGADPQITGQSFYVYYTDGGRWGNAQLARRLVTLDPSIPPASPPPIGTDPVDPIPDTDPVPDPIPMEWVHISKYREEFQPNAPAEGWTYAWNSNGKLGNSDNFSPLVWSDVANAYNTTGAATTVSGKKSNDDDYLQLHANWGHPGQQDFMPIVGYTIQDEDGEGVYRLVDSSLQKTDSTKSKGEDGLGVLVYLNDTLLGSTDVSTNGATANFDRQLGNLSVGDTVWVMIDPLNSQSYDAFTNFDFSLQKLMPIEGGMAALSLAATAVPEPSSSALLLIVAAGIGLGGRQTRHSRVVAKPMGPFCEG